MLKRRRLPHLYVIGQPLFVTFRLDDSLPANRPFPASNICSSLFRWGIETPRLAQSGQRQTSQPAAPADRTALLAEWYFENNPVTACLAARPEEYAWSSAGRPERPPQAEGLPHQ